MATSTTEIADTVTSCLSLFKSCLSQGSDDSLMALEGAQRRFRAWSNSLKVFARSHVSLDAQLLPARNEHIREMTLLLLGVLGENLSLVLNLMSTTKVPDSTADYLKVPFFGIDGSLKRLERLAAAILHATDISLYRRVLVYAEKKRDEDMERFVWQVLLARFPTLVPDTDLKNMRLLNSDDEELSDETQISERFRALLQSSCFSGLFRALFKTTMFRHYRMAYERERRLKDLNQLQPVIETSRQEESSAGPQPRQHYKKSEEPPPVKFKATTITTSPSKPDDTRSEPTLPNTIDGARFEAKMNTIEESDNEKDTVSESGTAIYPRPPRLLEDATEGICPLCGESCTIDIFEGHKWMSHVSRDIKPYVCISQDCLQNPQFFARSRQWKQHMQKIHTAQWIRSLHNLLNWKCPICHTISGTEFASEEILQQSLIKHMQTSHSHLEEDDLRQMASASSIPKPRSMDKCPICGDDHRKNSPELVPLAKGNGLDDQFSTADQAPKPEASRNHKRARFDIQQSSESESDKDGEENIAHVAGEEQQLDGLFTQISNHDRIEKHVGQHLKALAFYFANRLLQDLDLESNAPLGSGGDSALLDLESLSDQKSADDSPRLPAEIQRSKNDLDTEQGNEQECIAFNREQLFNGWGGDRRPPEPSLSPEQLECTFPSVTDGNQDKFWMPLGPEYTITYTTLTVVIIELCYSFQWPIISTLSHNELSLRLKPVKAFSRALRMFQRAKLDNTLTSNYIMEIKEYASRGLSISSNIQERLDHSMTWSSTLATEHENDMKELHAIRRSIEFRVTLVHINGYLSVEKFQGLENLSDLEPVHVNLIQEVTGFLSSPSPSFFESAISAIVNAYITTPPRPQPPNLWNQAFSDANDKTQRWLEEQGLDLQSSNGTQIQTQIKEVISLMKSKELSENVSESLTITIANHKIIVREYLADAIAFITMVGDAAIVFAPPQASVPWTIAKAVLKIPVNSIEQKAALVGTFEWFIRTTRRGQIYESLYTTETADEGAISNLHNALLELYTAAIELLAKFDNMARGGAFKELLTAVLSPKYATDLVAGLNKKEEVLDREAQNCEASRSAKSSEEMKVQVEDLKKQLAQLSPPLLQIDATVSSLFKKINEKEREKLMDFISSEMFGKSHATVTDTRIEDTGNWLLANRDFRTWQDIPSSSSIFLLKGAGGTGKTYLTSRVIDHVKSNLKELPHDEGFAFFYCNRSGSSMQQPIVVLRSFVRQLSGKAFGNPDEIQSSLAQKCAEAKIGGRELSYKDCEELILESFNVYSKTTIVLDALDESDIGTYNLAKHLIQMVEKSRQPVKIFISSRPDREYLEEIPKDKFLITVNAGNQHDDIQKYLEDKLYSTERFKRRRREMQDEIKDIFNTKGSGMFRWVYLQVKSLEKCITDDAVHLWTQRLPRDLTEAYNHLWESIQERDESDVALAERAIKWVLRSVKPLKTEALLEAVRYTIKESTIMREMEHSQQEVLSLCQDFLTIDDMQGVWMLPHVSIAEYFRMRGWTGGKCDAFAAKTCLGFLKNFQPEQTQDGTFAEYVENNWYEHVGRYDKWLGSKEEEEADPSVAAALKRFLGSPNESSDSYRKWAENNGANMRPSNMGLFAMCRYGFYYTLRDWWQDGKITEEMALRKNEDDQNSLALAAEGGCMPICRHLIGLIDAMHPDAERHAPALAAALKNGNDDVLKMLVMEANADVNFPDGEYWTAAQYAALNRPEMLRWMMGHGAVDLERENESSFECGNVLIAAAYGGNVEMVRILLAAGANVNAAVQNGSYGSALVAVAARCRAEDHVETARLLLDSGADPDLPLRGGRYGSALEALVVNVKKWKKDECGKLLHMLLEAGADPAAVFDRGSYGNALAAAAFYGQKDFLKAMIDHVGVDKAINTLGQSRHHDEREFEDQEDVERWKDTAAYLANEVGASKDVLRGIGLWDVEPVPNIFGRTVVRFAKYD